MLMAIRFALLAAAAAVMAAASPNIIVLLADDLGYGDLSVPPFNRGRIQTPELQKMADAGTVLSNFHVAAPVCTPSRAAILTALFPWRLGIRAIFGTGPQTNDHLLVVDNLANILSRRGYYTAHVGKWHLGGLKPTDVEARRDFADKEQACSLSTHPGPNQHGFHEYVAMMEGPQSARLSKLIPGKTLYHHGAKHLIGNDKPLPPSDHILTHRQVLEAVRIIETVSTTTPRQPFFLQLWFDAPHQPWELIEPFEALYKGIFPKNSNDLKYATMISSMDQAIGHLHKELRRLRLENDTLIVFLSDNGPENGAGSAAPFRGRKRSLLEGGIRVPCIWSWPGHIAAHRQSDKFVLATDLLPTFLDLAQVPRPVSLLIDGKSVAGSLLIPSARSKLIGKAEEEAQGSRQALWYRDIDGTEAAAWSHGLKYFEAKGGDSCVYRMSEDPTEEHCLPSTSVVFGSSKRASPRVGALEGLSKEVVGNLQQKLRSFVWNGSYAYHAVHKKPSCARFSETTLHTLHWE